jgi:putative membrane protein
MTQYISLFIKGMGMGAANVVPGVSGGTIALITGIFEKLIDSIKSFDHLSIKYFFTGKFKLLWQRMNMDFLIAVFAGIAISIITIARIFGYFLEHYPVYLMSLFFGLILASVYYVGKTVSKWNVPVILFFIFGTAIAISLSLLKPAQENSSLLYLVISGAVATCSMILPGLSGSFVLLLMGNYQLVMIDAVNNINIAILAPVVLGGVLGLILFSKLLSWVYKRFRNHTISILSGFILGSLGIIWPWKNTIPASDAAGNIIMKNGEALIEGYEWYFPQYSTEVIVAIAFMIAGIVIIGLTETLASKIKKD